MYAMKKKSVGAECNFTLLRNGSLTEWQYSTGDFGKYTLDYLNTTWSDIFMNLRNWLYSLLRHSERYTRTDMIYLAQGGFWLFTAKVIGFVSSLALATAMANLIAPDIFGTYKFALSAAGLLGALSLTGAPSAIIQAVARGYEGALVKCTKSYLRWSLGTVLIGVFAAIYYFLHQNVTLSLALLLAGILNPLLVTSSFFSPFLSGKRAFKAQSLLDGIADLFPTAVLIGALFITESPLILIATYFAAGITINSLLYLYTFRTYSPNDRHDPETLPYAKQLSLLGVMGKVGENIDKVLLFHFVGPVPLAIYVFAQTPIAQLKLLNEIPVKLAFPKMSQRNFFELQRSLPRKILFLILGMSAIVLLYIIVAPFLFELLFPAYLASVPITQVLALSLILVPGSLFYDALSSHMKKRELYISQTILPIIKIGLFLILLPPFGVWGAVATTLIWQVITFLLFAHLFLTAKP